MSGRQEDIGQLCRRCEEKIDNSEELYFLQCLVGFFGIGLHVEGLLPGISQPTLLLWGENDRLLHPKWGNAFASLLPRATLQTIPGAGHMPMLERPREVAEKITRFLEG